jgi:hypothetical protein
VQLSVAELTCGAHSVTVGVMPFTHRVAVDWMRVPLKPPAPMDVAVVPTPPEIQRGEESRDERDVGERPADEVVTPVRRPMEQVVQVDREEHAERLRQRTTPTVRGYHL